MPWLAAICFSQKCVIVNTSQCGKQNLAKTRFTDPFFLVFYQLFVLFCFFLVFIFFLSVLITEKIRHKIFLFQRAESVGSDRKSARFPILFGMLFFCCCKVLLDDQKNEKKRDSRRLLDSRGTVCRATSFIS